MEKLLVEWLKKNLGTLWNLDFLLLLRKDNLCRKENLYTQFLKCTRHSNSGELAPAAGIIFIRDERILTVRHMSN